MSVRASQPVAPFRAMRDRPSVYLQHTCLRHRYIRTKDLDGVWERPERLRAINVGVAALYARLEEANGLINFEPKLGMGPPPEAPFVIMQQAVKFDETCRKAFRYVHSGHEEDGAAWDLSVDVAKWCLDSKARIAREGSEIPEPYEQDLYICPESMSAFEAAISTVCEAVDFVIINAALRKDANELAYAPSDVPGPETYSSRVFVAVRPPGHHCGEATPAGFGFFNNVVVGSLHSYLEHDIGRIVIFDFDLHHGNGTQAIVEQIADDGRPAPKIFYGSMHDILSYPCEAGDQALIKDASLQSAGENGKWIHNVHIKPYQTEAEFWEHYEQTYTTIFSKAEEFIRSTSPTEDDNVLVFISCGFDASEYETKQMSRHKRHVPTGFYKKFTKAACDFADRYAQGRLVSVLEGGYSDRALISGAMSHLAGFAEAAGQVVDPRWWTSEELFKLEKLTKKRRGRKPRMDHLEWWLQRASQIADCLNRDPLLPETHCFAPPAPPAVPEPVPMKPKIPRRPRKKQPLPPPTTIQTRGAKRVGPSSQSPDGSEESDLGSKRGRYEEATEEEDDEEDSGSDYEPSYTTRVAAATLSRNWGRGRVSVPLSRSESSMSFSSEAIPAVGPLLGIQSAPYPPRTTTQSSNSGTGPMLKQQIVFGQSMLHETHSASPQPQDVEMEIEMERRLSHMNTHLSGAVSQ